MASTDARPVPRKNTAFRHYFAVRKNDGTLITTWAGADSEVSIDGAAFGDCTNEATEIGSSGCGYIDLTAAEMNGDAVVLKTTVTNTDALPVVITFFPEEAGDYRANTVQIEGTDATDALAAAALAGVAAYDPPTHFELVAAVSGLATATALATVGDDVSSILADTSELQADWANGGRLDLILDAAAVAGPTAAAIADAVWDEARSGHVSAGSFGEGVVVADKTGFELAFEGLDSVTIETGCNARQALSVIAAACGGVASGLATTTAVYKGAGVATNRITATVDADGNRSAVTLNLPS